MREATFLAQNEKKWRKIETIVDKNSEISPDHSADLFIELSDDLSYARTHYPDSITTRYLNDLAVGIFQNLNRGKTEKFHRIMKFWKWEVPLAMARHQKEMLFVFIFFLVAVIIGAVSTHYDPTFPRLVLGDEYVETTLDNISKGDPMGIYKDTEHNQMFLYITFNNIKVICYVFTAGLLFSLGTFYFLFTNGIMLGTFQYFFIQKGIVLDSLLSIWIHGTIEISCIIVSGTAGIVLGNSFLFPGTLSRKYSLITGAKEALKILVGLVPLIILAAFLESFITRLTDSPILFRGGIILLSLIFVTWYFVIYPLRLKNKTPP